MNILSAMRGGHEPNEEYSMDSEKYRKLLLKNDIVDNENINTTSFGIKRQEKIVVDPETEYSFNNFGYRDIDWIGRPTILAVGCSNTWGFGVTVEGRWTNILSKKINKEVRNLSFPGASINELVAKSFEHFKMFGNPDVMLCLFPDPFRIRLPIKKNLVKSNSTHKGSQKLNDDLFLANVYFDENLEKNTSKIKYFKTPYAYEEILPSELSIFFSMQSIHMLEQYCKSNNIKLIWTSWHYETSELLDNVKPNIFDNFILNKDLIIFHNEHDFSKNFDKNCHEEYKDKFAKYFDRGCDIEDGINYSHPGVHKHIHIAEAFYKEITK
jgi:hypothetical protein